jgi:spermidine synthase
VKQPIWKILLSYLTELHIESAPSEINPHLYVSLSKGRYQLSTANAVYSYGDLYDNYRKIFERMNLPNSQIEKVLILGFGLGSVPFMLEKKFEQKYHYTGIEIDENVVYLAEKYVISELNSPIEIYCADAFSFVMQTSEKFDLIAMDVFLDDIIPNNFHSQEFLIALKDLIEENGLLLYNRLSLTEQDQKDTQSFYESEFLTVFPNGTYLDVGGNWMLMNKPIP